MVRYDEPTRDDLGPPARGAADFEPRRASAPSPYDFVRDTRHMLAISRIRSSNYIACILTYLKPSGIFTRSQARHQGEGRSSSSLCSVSRSTSRLDDASRAYAARRRPRNEDGT